VPNLNALPAAESEVAHIGSLFSRSDVLVKTAATETAVRTGVADADVLHFACHGRFDFDRPQLSALHFSPDAQHDGPLTVSEIFALDLNRTRLVVLSACETGLSKIVKGDELIGFSRAFIYAGAPSLISSLWPVSDESTSEMMKVFYSSLDHDARDVALSKAQIEVRKRFPHPYFWSAFVLVGDWHR
jgi:CHAT domain-containing protein